MGSSRRSRRGPVQDQPVQDQPVQDQPGQGQPGQAMSGLTVLRREDQTVSVALEDRNLKPGLSDLRWRLPRLVGSGADTLVIDLSGVERLSSASIATLLFAKRTCAARRVRVVLSSPRPRTLEQLTRTGLTNVLEIERELP